MTFKRQKNLLQFKGEVLTVEAVLEPGKEKTVSIYNSCHHASVHLPANRTVQSSMGLLQVCFPVYEELSWDDTTTPNELVKITEDQLARADQQLTDALRPCSLFDTDADIEDIKYKDFTDDMFEDECILELPLDEKRRVHRQNAFRRKLSVNVFETQNVYESGNESDDLLAGDDTADNENEAQTDDQFDIGNNTHGEDPFGNHNNVPIEGNPESRLRIYANTESSLCSLLIVSMLLLLICVFSIVIIS